jgi:hypothetical protein
VVFLWNVIVSSRGGAPAPDNPWDAGTLEWATSSPPPAYNFARIPVVTHREPLWAERETRPVVTGLRVDRRELIVSTLTDARAEVREASPEPSIWPLIAAIAVTIFFIGSIFTPWAVVWGSIPVAVALTGWFWPRSPRPHEGPQRAVVRERMA